MKDKKEKTGEESLVVTPEDAKTVEELQALVEQYRKELALANEEVKLKALEQEELLRLNTELQSQLEVKTVATEKGIITFELGGKVYESLMEVPFYSNITGTQVQRAELMKTEQGRQLLQEHIDKGCTMFKYIKDLRTKTSTI